MTRAHASKPRSETVPASRPLATQQPVGDPASEPADVETQVRLADRLGHSLSNVPVSTGTARGTRRRFGSMAEELRALASPARERGGEAVHQAAKLGTRGPAVPLPHLETIQRSFGRHDVGRVRAHLGASAEEGAGALGADGFTVGSDVVFARPPGLYTAAHEAAHVLQQRGGVRIPGGIGRPGDRHERHADAVASRVMRGQSAEPLLDSVAQGSQPAAAPPVQCLMTSDQYKQALPQQHNDKDLDGLANALQNYHNKKNNTAHDLQGRLQMLNLLSRRAHGLLRDRRDAPPQIKQVLTGLAGELEAEHREVIVAVRNDPKQAPIDTFGMKDEEVQQVKTLWRSIVEGKGNLQVQHRGDNDFLDRTHANIAQLLQGEHGRAMLSTLNAPQNDENRQVIISHQFDQEVANSQYVDQEAHGSYAYPIVTAKTGQKPHLINDNDTPNTGSGSYVKVAPEPSVNSGEHDEPILTPGFVTLGHELGHAQNNLQGVGRSKRRAPQAENGLLDEQLWSNEEEYQNIRQNENAIRKEHNLAPRKYHAGQPEVVHQKHRTRLDDRLLSAYNQIPDSLMERVKRRLPESLDEMIGTVTAIRGQPHFKDFAHPPNVSAFEQQLQNVETALPHAIKDAHASEANAQLEEARRKQVLLEDFDFDF